MLEGLTMRSYIVVLFLFTSTYLFSQNKTLDSLYAVLNGHPKEDSIKIDLIFKICRVEFFGSNKEKVVALAEDGLAISKEINYIKGEGFAYNYLALYYQSTGDFDKVADYSMKMAEVYERSKNDAGRGRAYNMLSLVHQQWKNYEKAESYLKKALEINQKLGNKLGMAVNYMNLGVTLGLTENYDSAINYFIKALALGQELGDEKEIANAYTNLGYAYVQKKDLKRALQNYEKAYPLALKTNNLVSQFEINIGLLKIYTTSGNYQKSATYAGNSLTLAKELKDKTRMHDAYQWFSEIEKQKNNYQKAFTYLEMAHAYKDSIFTEAKALQIAELEAKYETEKKEQTIRLLNKDKKIQTLWTNILLTGLVLVVIVAVVAYQLQRYREKKNLDFLHIQIDLLTSQHQQLSEKYKHAITGTDNRIIESADQRLLRTALEIVEKNISDPFFGVEKMAEAIAMSRANLHRKLKAVTGFSPSDFIRNVRLKRAANLLRGNADTVAQIGFSVGFEDQSYFSKSFKKQFGISPTEYSRTSAN